MSACEIVNLSGFTSSLNLMRLELSNNEVEGFKVGQYVRDTTRNRIARIHRFARSEGIFKADVTYWRKDPMSICKPLMKMVGLFELEEIRKPADALPFLRSFDSLPRKGM
jgi:hypothetical protein